MHVAIVSYNKQNVSKVKIKVTINYVIQLDAKRHDPSHFVIVRDNTFFKNHHFKKIQLTGLFIKCKTREGLKFCA